MAAADSHFVFDLSGGHLALDFANTVTDRPGKALERLPVYRELVRFGRHSGVYPPTVVDRLYVKGAEQPEVAETALQEAIRLREALFAIFYAVAGGSEAPAQALARLTVAAQNVASHGRLVEVGKQFEWRWVAMDGYLDSVLWPVTRAAVDLLLSDDLKNVRVCASEDCAWLFLDKTKNHGRRWCDMKTCGNRVKARRHYEKALSGRRE
jgi:predicted RNA-binding Zn ribbon-like protein